MPAKTISRKALIIYIIVLILLSCLLSGGSSAIANAASDTYAFDRTTVYDDLSSASDFDFNDYPANSSGDFAVVNFVEFGWAYYANERDNYALYIYIYNPAKTDIATGSGSNKIQLGTAYSTAADDSLKVDSYSKLKLVYCNNYNNLIYKFRVAPAEDGITVGYFPVDGSRRYDVSGFELFAYGDRTATESGVGGTYTFTGYAAGLGKDNTSLSTLKCNVIDLDTVELEVKHSTFRTEGISELGEGHYNEINSVYFAVPEKYFEKYGNLQKITAEWWEYKTKPIMVTSNADFKNQFLPYTKQKIANYDSNVPVSLWYGYDSNRGLNSNIFTSYEWAYNMETYTKSGFGWSDVQMVGKYSNIIPYAFYSDKKTVQGVFDFLNKQTVAGDVTSSKLSDWIYSYSNNLGNGYIDCNGRSISADLFETSIDSKRAAQDYKVGYNHRTIDLADTFNLDSWDSSHASGFWDKLWAFGFSWPRTDEQYKNVVPIVDVPGETLTDGCSAEYLINAEDEADFIKFGKSAIEDGNRLILFRFASTDYFARAVGRTGVAEKNSDTYIAQQTVFLDFDIIELTFSRDGVNHTIPVVADPIDIINGVTAPQVDDTIWDKIFEWLKDTWDKIVAWFARIKPILIKVLIGIAAVIGAALIIWAIVAIIRRTRGGGRQQLDITVNGTPTQTTRRKPQPKARLKPRKQRRTKA
jgi:hypothetical protein